ncbi:MAG: hypothetical protein G01um101430_130 [Parcubacteria group bacterium Gr01-1014_30]|nr:MAG: hypothetical protein G01um101430_130 [Parcubacteria group bacterium Gr01-1014_30]
MKKVLIIGVFVILALVALGLIGNIRKGEELTPEPTPSPTPTPADSSVPTPTPTPIKGAQNDRIESMRVILEEGARPRFSPDGQYFLFDRRNSNDLYADLYVSDLNGGIVTRLTEGREGVNQRNNGNGVYHSSKNYIIFISEESGHYLDDDKWLADPGIGLFSNLYATDFSGSRFWKLTDIPIKKALGDGIPATATVNPHFLKNGTLIWTERYAEGGNLNWGKWRLKAADFVEENGVPKLINTRVVYTPANGNYVTFMGELDSDNWVVSGNLNGQHEYGMDQYVLNIRNGSLKNLTNTPEYWEEDSSLTPSGKIVYMSNIDSQYKFDFTKDWVIQKVERDYYITDRNGGQKERLTFFNEPGAVEKSEYAILSVAADISPDGKYMAGTVGVQFGAGKDRGRIVLKIVLIKFKNPF